jgi:hypothetical protein
MTERSINLGGGLALAITLVALSPAPASAASTRAEYVAQVDPICHGIEVKEIAATRIFKRRIRHLHVRPVDLESKPVRRAAVRFYRSVLRSFRSGFDQIAAVPPAPGDEAVVSAWLQGLRKFERRFQRVIPLVARGEERKAGRALSRAFKVAGQADLRVQDFGFQHCAS